MITNIYEFYLEDNKDKPKNELQEVTQVDSHIDVELDTPEIQLSDSPSIGVEIKDSSIISNDSIDISNITKSSVELGKESADFIISLIKPAIDKVSDSIADEVKSIMDTPTSTVAKVTEGDIENENPISKIIDEYKMDLQELIIDATREVINRDITKDSSILSNIILTKNENNNDRNSNDSLPSSDIELIRDDNNDLNDSFSLSDIKLIKDNDIAKYSFEQELKGSLINELGSSLSKINDKYNDLGSFINNEIRRIESDVVNTTIDTINNITDSVLVPIMKAIDTVMIDLSTKPPNIISEDIRDIENSTYEIVQDLSKQVTGIIDKYVDGFYKVMDQVSHESIDKGRGWIREHVNDVLNENFSELKGIDFDDVLDKLRGIDSDKIPGLIRVDNIPKFMENKWKYLRNRGKLGLISYKYYIFSTTFDWLIKIRPINKQLPDLNSLLRISDDDFLPITSYSLTEAGLDSMSYQVLTNTIIVPQRYRRPSRLTITLPDIYVGESNYVHLRNEGRTYLREFKEEFIDYVKMVDNYPKYSLVSRDYRDCCYEITLYRFPYMATLDNNIDRAAFCKTYLGIPEISINESGNESKQLVTDTLIFNIVGEVT